MSAPAPPPTSPALAPRWLVWLIGFFAFINVYSMQSVLPLVVRDFAATPVQAGATVGATVLAVALVSPFIGMLSDALGRRNVLCASLAALVVPTALIAVVDSLDAVIALRFVQGLFVPGIVVVLMAYIGEEFKGDGMTRMSSVYMSGAVMGGFSGRFITGHAGHLLGWRGAFVLIAILNLIGAALAVWRLPRSRHFTANRDLGGALRTFGRHLHNPQLIAACAVGFCVLFSLVGAFTYVNLMLVEPPFGLSVSALANVFCVYLVGVVVTPLSGRLIVRLGNRNALLGALTLSVGGMLLTLAPSLAAVVAGLTACSSGVFICQAATISYIAGAIREGRSLANGLYYASYYAGGAAGSWLAGLAYEAHGWAGSVACIIAVQTLAAAIAVFGWKRAVARH